MGYRAVIDLRGGQRLDASQLARRSAAYGLIFAMAVGSVALWTALPLGATWLVYQPSIAYGELAEWSFPLVAAAVTAAMALGAVVLARLERAYARVTRAAPEPRAVPAWRRSIGESRAPVARGVLERIMVASVLLAIAAFTVWFIVLAHYVAPS